MRYAIRPKAAWSDPQPLIEGREVYEAEPADTGLVDKQGNAIVRLKDPIGFIDWDQPQ